MEINKEDIKNLQEEIFCLKFELETLSGHLVKNNLERMLPNFTQEIIEYAHRQRYELAASLTKDKDVIDIACGTGYGTFFLAQSGNVRRITGYDLSSDAVRYASHRYNDPSLVYKQGNAETLLLEDKVDIIISFETIEHLPNHESFLKSSFNNLKDDGLFVVSTPISMHDIDEQPINPHHIREWGFESFHKVIANHFKIVEVYVQLYRHPFMNESIMTEFLKTQSFSQRIKNKIKKKITGREFVPPLYNIWNDISNYPILEKYEGQYKSEDLGTKYIGYQTLICQKL